MVEDKGNELDNGLDNEDDSLQGMKELDDCDNDDEVVVEERQVENMMVQYMMNVDYTVCDVSDDKMTKEAEDADENGSMMDGDDYEVGNDDNRQKEEVVVEHDVLAEMDCSKIWNNQVLRLHAFFEDLGKLEMNQKEMNVIVHQSHQQASKQ